MTCAALVLTLGLVAGAPVAPAPDGRAGVPARPAEPAAPDSLADLPLVLAQAPPGPLLAVILTGDGGWAPADRSLTAALVRRNVAVVGLDSPRYLARDPTPDAAAGDLARILRHFLPAWHRERVVIVGYSRGADIGPFMVARLPAELRERVALTALLGPGEWASFKHGLLDILHDHSRSGLPVSSEVARLRGKAVLCIYGSRDRGAICPSLQQAGLARTVIRNGGHAVHRDEGTALVHVILGALQRQPLSSGEFWSASAGSPESAP
jgi:type IV secretory pathway VirJ component